MGWFNRETRNPGRKPLFCAEWIGFKIKWIWKRTVYRQLLPLTCLNAGLVALGCWLVFRSIHRIETHSFPNLLAVARHGFTFYIADPVSSIHHFEHRIKELSHKYRSLAQFME